MLQYALTNNDDSEIKEKYKNKWERMSLLYMYMMYANNIDILPERVTYDGWQTDLL